MHGLSRRTSATFGNGRVKTYDYEADSALKSITHQNLIETSPGEVHDAVWVFNYSPANQVSSKSLPIDFIYRTASAVDDDYVVNGLNQYTAIKGQAVTYDANGNLITSGIWAYTYDAENRLVTATNGLITATYVYGPLDRRIAKTVTTSGGNPVETRYLYAGSDVIAEFTGGGTLLRQYVHGPQVDEPVVMLDPTQPVADEQVQYYHADHAGTVVATSDNVGNLAEKYSYSSFGEVGIEGVEGNPYRFAGRRLDPETGLYFYRARYYNASLGRFLQIDPIGYQDSMGLYQYALNDPLNRIDPSGTLVIWVEADAIANLGVTPVEVNGSTGFYLSIPTSRGQKFSFGPYVAGGAGLGVHDGVAADFGFLQGDVRDFQGPSVEVSGDFGIFGFGAQLPLNSDGKPIGDKLGFSAGFGPQIGGSILVKNTEVFPWAGFDPSTESNSTDSGSSNSEGTAGNSSVSSTVNVGNVMQGANDRRDANQISGSVCIRLRAALCF
ncbi:MAG: RHS repeat-associated core domain-containing protein [Rhodospirillaceae bacterium]